MQEEDEAVKKEVEYSFKYVFLFSDWLGMRLRRDESISASFLDSLKQKKMFCISLFTTGYAVTGLVLFIALGADRAFTVEYVVPKVHIFGFTFLSFSKGVLVFANMKILRESVHEVYNLWPRPPLSSQSLAIKESSVWRVRIIHKLYIISTYVAVVLFMVIPIATRLHKHFHGKIYVKTLTFDIWFPVNMSAPFYYELCLFCTNIIGFNTVTIVMNANVIFTGLSNHICMFFRMLQEEIRGLRENEEAGQYETFDDYKFWLKVIKRHQELITYIDLLESLYSPIFLVQFLLSSIDICCAGFTGMVIDYSTLPPNITFIMSHLGEIGLLCWYGDDVYRESMKVSDAIYESDWCRSSPRSKKLMLYMMIRAQKPLRFTALRFKDINLETFSGIVVTSYSYFTLLLNVYS